VVGAAQLISEQHCRHGEFIFPPHPAARNGVVFLSSSLCAATSRRILHEFNDVIEPLQKSMERFEHKKSSTGCQDLPSLKSINDTYVNALIKETHIDGMDLVSIARKRATSYLVKAAMAHPKVGDFVETGVYTGGSTATIMKLLLQFDTCKRKFWVFDSFQGLHAAAAEDVDRKGNQGGLSDHRGPLPGKSCQGECLGR
jgi:hypothetical protein